MSKKTMITIYMYCICIILFILPGPSLAEEYIYDGHGQIIKVNYTTVTFLEYTYDNIGNRLTSTVDVPPVDTDQDGLPDDLENATCTDPYDADTDDDGILDGMEDTNHNGIVEYPETDPCNIDTDGDGIQDGTETGVTLADIGPDTDLAIFIPDADPSTTTDPNRKDSDGDGASDGREDKNKNGRVDPGESDPSDENSFEIDIVPTIFLLLLSED
ncbi:MAG: MSCRAMM family adhesin SdrC [Desulfobacteraceae bacterium]|nr:MSCRAMM family adhesin SdrC [Desulfobacteraceae bacterium]